MSLKEFSDALKLKATESLAEEAISSLREVQLRLLTNASAIYKSRNKMIRNASILEQDADAFRSKGEKQGRTRLVITKDSLLALVRRMHSSSELKDSDIMRSYLDFLDSNNFGKLKAKRFEIYTEKGKQSSTSGTLSSLIETTAQETVIAFRGLNFSHANTLTHIDQYLRSIGAFSGMSTTVSKKAISAEFERGHVYAQTTGRQLLSIGGISKDNDILDKLVSLSLHLDRASSSLRNPIYAELDAEISKDFSDTAAFMNVEFQARFSADGTGNQDTGKIAGGLQLISSMLKLLDNMSYTGRGRLNSAPVISQITSAVKSFDNLLVKLNKQTEAMEKVLKGYMDDPEKYIADLKSSPSLKTFVKNSVVSKLSGERVAPVKIHHNPTKVYTSKIAGIKKSANTNGKALIAAKKELTDIAKALKTKVILPTATPKSVNLTSLQTLINSQLQDVISANMGDGDARNVLNYRTGRLAASASVQRMSESRAGMITAFYTYMKNPYQTFEPGFKQGSPKSRDPKLLIGKSIREIAAARVGNRLRAVSI